MSEKPGIAERYMMASQSSNLSLNPERVHDVDVLIASALAKKDGSMCLALKVARMQATGSNAGIHAMAAEAGQWLLRASRVRSRFGSHLRSVAKSSLTTGQANRLALAVLRWMKSPVCTVCGGHGHPKMENAPILNTELICPACHGDGVVPLVNAVRNKYIDQAKWLVSELEHQGARAFEEMSQRLRN